MLLILLLVASISFGSTVVNPLGIFESSFIIHTLRLPRIIISLLTGGALGIAGLILQGVIRNPLASPDVIGITGGSKVAAVLYLTIFASNKIIYLPIIAVTGALIAAIIIYLLTWKAGISPLKLVLIGIGVDSLLSAIVTMLIVYSPTYSTSEAYIWMVGSVYGSNWKNVFALLPWTITLVPLSVVFARKLSIQDLGDDIAKSSGLSVERNRLLMLLLSVFLAGTSIAFAGGISFVGLIAPHIAKRLINRSYISLIFLSFIIGAMLVVLSDLLARTVFLPLDIPVGVFVSGIGAPFFIYLLYKNRNL